MKKNVFLVNLSLLMFTIVGFFSFLIGNIYYLLIISVVPISLYIFSVMIAMGKENITWFVLLLFMWVSALITHIPLWSYKFLLAFCIMFIAKLIFESIYGWQNKFAKFFYICSLIHVAAILLSLVIPDVIRDIVSRFYVDEDYLRYTTFMEYGAFAGLTPQTGYAAYFASVLTGFSVCSVICDHKKVVNYILVLLSILAIFLTMKRSFLISNAVAIIFCFLINNKTDKIKNILKYVILIIVAYHILSLIPETQGIFLKFENHINSGDISNGRFELWEETIEVWKKSPLFGVGINTLPRAYGIASHNVYIQLLAEIGVFGVLAFIVAVLVTFFSSCSIYSKILSEKTTTSFDKVLYSTCIYLQIIFLVYCFAGNPLYDLNFLLIYILSVACIKSKANKKAN